jgi:hypothetical protein
VVPIEPHEAQESTMEAWEVRIAAFKARMIAEKFDIRDWLPLDAAVARAYESWGNRDMAFEELRRELHDGRLEFALVGEGAHFFPRPAHWRWLRLEAGTTVTDHVRVLNVSEGGRGPAFFQARGVDGRRVSIMWTGHTFIRRAQFDALYLPSKSGANPPSKPVAEPGPTVRVAGIDWASRIARRMQADGEIPEGIDQRPLAKMIAQRMQADPSSGKPLSADYIRSHLKEWGLWPPKLIK